jgi:ABC-type nitrate/sulfonate/bicarbonate transport system permease component
VAGHRARLRRPRVHLPEPLQIAQQFGEFSGPLLEAAWKTFWVTMLGFGLAIVVGVLLGFLIGSSRMAYTALYPLMVAFNAVPKAAVVPILVVWFGIGVGPGVLTAFLISFFPITVNIATGLATLEPELEDVLRVLGAKRWDVLVKVGLPRSMPYFYGSLKIAITLAFVGTVLAEMTAGDSGIGYLMQSGRQPAAHAAGLCRAGDHRRDGHGHVRAVQLDREAHHRLGAPQLATSERLGRGRHDAFERAGASPSAAGQRVARASLAAGHHPFGAVLVAADGETVLLSRATSTPSTTPKRCWHARPPPALTRPRCGTARW